MKIDYTHFMYLYTKKREGELKRDFTNERETRACVREKYNEIERERKK